MRSFRTFPKIVFVVMIMMALAAIACGSSEDKIAKAIEETRAAEEALAPEEEPTETQISEAEIAAQETADAQAATEEYAIAQTATSDAEATEALDMINAISTESALEMYDRILEIYENGDLSRTEGEYYPLLDFDESWAQLNWYQWWPTYYAPTDFVIRADASWDSASETANWFSSGCGFVFREDGADNHYLVFLGLDGNVYFARTVRGNFAPLGGASRYGRLDTPSGEAEIMLVVEGDRFTFYVNGERVGNRVDPSLEEGNLNLTLLSGTNAGFGTRCNMTDIDLWVLD